MKFLSLLVCLLFCSIHITQTMDSQSITRPEPIQICIDALKTNNIELLRHGLSLPNMDINYQDSKQKACLLWVACIQPEHKEFALEILKHKDIDVTLCDKENGMTSLHTAAFSNSPCIINEILKKNPTTGSIPSKNGQLPLHIAATFGHKEAIKSLLSEKHINYQDYNGDTPLHMACTLKQYSIIQQLIESGACTTIKNHKQFTPFYSLYCVLKQEDIINLSDSLGVDIINKLIHATDEYDNTQLHLCSQISPDTEEQLKKHRNYLLFLISQNIDKNAKNKATKTATDLAFEEFNELLNQCLEEKLPYLTKALATQQQITENFTQTCCSEEKTIELYNAINPLTKEEKFIKPWLIVTKPTSDSYATKICKKGVKKNSLIMVKMGINNGAHITYSLLCDALEQNNTKIIKELLDHPTVNINLPDPSSGETFFDVAMDHQSAAGLKYILTLNPDLANTINENGETPLHIAAKKAQLDHMQELIIAYKTNINHQDNNGNTPLHNTCESYGKNDNIAKAIQLLIINGAKTTIKNNLCKTPFLALLLNFNFNFDDFIKVYPSVAGELITATDKQKNTQFHLCTKLSPIQTINGCQEYLSILAAHNVNIHARNKKGKTATDLACQTYYDLYNHYMIKKLPYIKEALDQQEDIMLSFLCLTSPQTQYQAFKQLLQQKDSDNLPLPPEVKTYIARLYYTLSIDTIIAKKYLSNRAYYDDFIENKNNIKQKLLNNPEPQLLWQPYK